MSGVEVTGVRELVRDLDALAREIEDPSALDAIADEGARIVADQAPRDTEALARSPRGEHTKGQAVVHIGGPTISYAGPINYGVPSRNISATHYLEATDQVLEPFALDRLEDDLNDQIRRKGLS